MSFAVGAGVVVRTLGRKRGTILEAGRNGRYHVRVEGVTIWCAADDLGAVPDVGRKKRASAIHLPDPSAARGEAAPPDRVDLHGLHVEEAMTRVVDEISRAILRGSDRMEIVHGKGSGRIRHALHRRLASMTVVAAFKLDPGNPGVTWVFF